MTSDERREVSERLRSVTDEELRHLFTEEILNGSFGGRCVDDEGDIDVRLILNHLADLIDRPTCRNVSGYQDVFECSECRCKVELITEVSNEYGEPFSMSLMPSFCPDCGALVMDDE